MLHSPLILPACSCHFCKRVLFTVPRVVYISLALSFPSALSFELFVFSLSFITFFIRSFSWFLPSNLDPFSSHLGSLKYSQLLVSFKKFSGKLVINCGTVELHVDIFSRSLDSLYFVQGRFNYWWIFKNWCKLMQMDVLCFRANWLKWWFKSAITRFSFHMEPNLFTIPPFTSSSTLIIN